MRGYMEEKIYPQREFSTIQTSTILVCDACKKETKIFEKVLTDGAIYLHESCGPSVHTVEVEEPPASEKASTETEEEKEG